ncbi:uncharacterized protein LOC143240247 isoform X3 [Tachypleus tridentatus]|uniref:uncharacterized protein LOC143240247 isoform X3 n=1 Tax=Tachypleus tridentatus TaxID=6853 RepID=UPI003FD21EDC
MCCVLCYTTSDNVTSFSKTSVQTSEPFTGFHDEMQESPLLVYRTDPPPLLYLECFPMALAACLWIYNARNLFRCPLWAVHR